MALNAGIGVNGDFTRDIPLGDDRRLIAVNNTEFFERAGMEDTKAGAGDMDDPAEVAESRLLPESAKAALHAAQTRPGTGDDS